METITIPKLSFLTKDKQLFASLARFSAVTGYDPTTTVTTGEHYSINKENRLTSIMRALRQSILKPSRGTYDILSSDEHQYALFSQDVQSELRERKKILAQLIKKHETAVDELRVARVQCWKSQSKIKDYQLMIETQTSALKHNQHEQKARTVALEESETALDKWLARHEKDHIIFETKLLKELTYREKIKKMAVQLESDIIVQIQYDIENLMTANKQDISYREMNKLARQIYKKSCRTYKFAIIENIPCEKQWIEKPSSLNGSDKTNKTLHAPVTKMT